MAGRRSGLIESAIAFLPLIAIVGCLAILSIGPRLQPATPRASLAQVRAPTTDIVLTRIALGACFVHSRPAPIWSAILAAEPDLMVTLGDNVYGDAKSGTTRELEAAYDQLAAHPDFAPARNNLSFLATWDDHDCGLNDGGANFALRVQSERLFRKFWGVPEGPPEGSGIYRSVMIGPKGKRVQFLLLDTRSFRTPLTRKPKNSEIWGRYVPSRDPAQSMLGEAQWQWLERELKRPADLRILVSSIQVLAEGHGWERWANLPREQKRLLDLLDGLAEDVVIVSGDRHFGASYRRNVDGGAMLAEVTSSSLNRAFRPKDAPGPFRVGEPFGAENFGTIEIDWQARTARIGLRDVNGDQVATELIVSLARPATTR
ncbi:MAG: alkaline phosphatase D family protein [Hyphomicrobiaceae bacterium]